uniref:Uncharacterized protein n=1 Tax=Setaria digitata TaxID=48799 RepID=A0A915PQ37_9BILA
MQAVSLLQITAEDEICERRRQRPRRHRRRRTVRSRSCCAPSSHLITHTFSLRAVTVCGHVVLAFTAVPHKRFWPARPGVDHIGPGY